MSFGLVRAKIFSSSRVLLGRERKLLGDPRALPPLPVQAPGRGRRPRRADPARARRPPSRATSQAVLRSEVCGDVVALRQEVTSRSRRSSSWSAAESPDDAWAGPERRRRGAVARDGEREQEQRRRDPDRPAQRAAGAAPGGPRAGSRAIVASAAASHCSGVRAVDRLDVLLGQLAHGGLSTPAARGCSAWHSERCRGRTSGSPAAGAASVKSSASVRCAESRSVFRSMGCSLAAENPTAAHESCGRPGRGAT